MQQSPDNKRKPDEHSRLQSELHHLHSVVKELNKDKTRLQEELKQEKSDLKRWRHRWEQLPAALLECDREGRILDANQAASTLLGHAIKSLRNKPFPGPGNHLTKPSPDGKRIAFDPSSLLRDSPSPTKMILHRPEGESVQVTLTVRSCNWKTPTCLIHMGVDSSLCSGKTQKPPVARTDSTEDLLVEESTDTYHTEEPPALSPAPITKSEDQPATALTDLDYMPYHLVFHAIEIPCFIIDCETLVIVDANEAAAQAYEYPREKLVGMSSIRLSYEPADSAQALREGFHHVPVRRHRKSDGSVFPVEIWFSPIKVNEQCMTAALVLDLTERIEVEDALVAEKEKAELATRAKTDFLAMMSHEIRTPLNAIMGFAELLTLRDLDPDARSYAERVISSSEALLTLLTRIIDYSRLDYGARTVLALRPINPSQELRQTANIYQNRARDKGLSFITKIDQSVPLLVEGDPARFRQVLSNLFDNAIRFTNEGYIAFRAWGRYLAERDLYRVDVQIEDTGCGIPRSSLVKIFEPFEQVEAPESRLRMGAGLGLAICRSLVELMGGSIWCESQLNSGSRFHFYVLFKPIVKDQASLPRDPESHSPSQGLNILALESDPDRRDDLKQSLNKLDVSVQFAQSMSEAAIRMHNKAFDVIILDPILHREKLDRIRNLGGGVAPYVVGLAARQVDPQIRLPQVDGWLSCPTKAEEVEVLLRRLQL